MKTKKEIKKTHTLIISDLHLGTEVASPKKVLKLLRSYSFRKLILLGDIFDNMDFRHLNKDSWALLSYIGRISKDKRVRWVIGNHDSGLADIFRTLIDARIYETYIWKYNHKKYLAIHGHQFDRFLVDNELISYLATIIYNFIQKVDSEKKVVSRYLKRKSKGWLRLSEKVAHGAMQYARKNGADYVFCGHTHRPAEKKNHTVSYFNSGCWTDSPCSYITIDKDGIVIHEY